MSLPPFPRYPVDPVLIEGSLSQIVYRDQGTVISVGDFIASLQRAGIGVYVVGGSPRDWLRGHAAKDIDISVDHSIDDVHACLRAAYGGIDPVITRFAQFGIMRWGDPALSPVDVSIIRSPEDICNNDFDQSHFHPRRDLIADARFRDFSINVFYYDGTSPAVIDPLHCGLRDVHARVLRLIADPAVLAGNPQLTLRIIDFCERGYRPVANIADYLGQYADEDIRQMRDRIGMWLGDYVPRDPDKCARFRDRLMPWLRTEESREIFAHALSRHAAG